MKIAACDFDGTLFRDGVVSEADLEAIADWRRSGNAFGIVTGRGRNTLLRDVKRFSIPYDFLICISTPPPRSCWGLTISAI